MAGLAQGPPDEPVRVPLPLPPRIKEQVSDEVFAHLLKESAMSIHETASDAQGRVALPEDGGVPAEVRMRAKALGERVVMGNLTYFLWLVGQAQAGAAAMGDLNDEEVLRVRARAIRLAESTLIALALRERPSR